nr:DUF2845 domain-containing protein [Amycolatopsis umgeniensis]
MLGHPPPEALSVFDPGVRKRFWVGHETCTGFSLRTRKRSAEELLERLRRYRQRELAASAPRRSGQRGVVQVGMSPEQVLRLLGPPHERVTLREYLARMGDKGILQFEPSDDEYWLYSGVPSGHDTEVTFRNARVVRVQTPRTNT